MGSVGFGFSMSLDGFVAGPNDSPTNPLGDGGNRLFEWYFVGDTDYEVPMGDSAMKMNRAGAEMIQEAGRKTGALISGRRTFDIANAWGGRHPLDVPVVVVTHRVPRNGTGKEPSSPSSPTGLRARLKRPGKSPGIRTSRLAAQVLPGRLSKPAWSTKFRSTWCPSCSAAGCACSTSSGASRFSSRTRSQRCPERHPPQLPGDKVRI